MLKDIYWRRYPIDLLNDDKMLYIESLMPEKLKYAPYMFYITALKLADDDGVFDLEDGVIFARLMRVPDVQIVFEVANLMRQRKVIYRLFDDSNYCGLTDWEYAKNEKVRSIEERRQVVAQAIKEAQKKQHSEKDFVIAKNAGKYNAIPYSNSCAGKCNDIPQTMATDNAPESNVFAPDSSSFLCSENDKKTENVVKTRMDDKNAENVVKNENCDNFPENVVIHREREERENKEIEQNTHTEKKEQLPGSESLQSSTPGNCKETTPAVAETNLTETQNSESDENNSDYSQTDTSCLAERALKLEVVEDEKNDESGLLSYLNEFFVKNCYGYKPKQSAHALKKLAEEIEAVSDEVNPPLEVAAILCSEYKNMTEGKRNEYWKGMPLLPSFMYKPRCWQELMQYAGKILAKSNAHNRFLEAAKKAEEEYQKDAAAISVARRDEYLKYGIAPEDPNAVRKLLQAKSREQEALREEKAEEVRF
ncbi:MAG: hypothetical protein K6D95_04750 [Treponema sp.]|nr:hypothetical protein [Treponema sp.]